MSDCAIIEKMKHTLNDKVQRQERNKKYEGRTVDMYPRGKKRPTKKQTSYIHNETENGRKSSLWNRKD